MMKDAGLHQEAQWVLTCLKDLRFHSLVEVTEEYNKQHPPTLFVRTPKTPYFIQPILQSLIEEKLVRFEVFTFLEEPIPPTRYYTLTNLGIAYMSKRR